MITVLSIDGGGIRGLIPALVLHHLEEKTGCQTADLFDLIAGTSAGGLIALGLTVPEKSSDGDPDPRYSAQEIVDLFRERGGDIFSRSRWRTVTTAVGVREELYPHDDLVDVLTEYFGNQPVGDAVTDAMVSSYDIQNREPFFFMSWRSPDASVPMRRAGRATSAAPTYFEPAKVALGDQVRVLVDGGVFANNPAVSAYAEAEQRFPDEEIRIVSIGTGSSTHPISYDEAQDWGKYHWGLHLFDVIFDGNSDAADYQLRHVIGDRFERFQVPLETANDAMDDASPQNLKGLTQDAERMIELHQEDLAALSDRLDRSSGTSEGGEPNSQSP